MRQIININKDWTFLKGAEDSENTFEKEIVTLPHTWNAIDGQDGGADYYRGVCYYDKKIVLADLPVADEYYLEINAANSSAKVVLNGEEIATHDGGYSTFRVKLNLKEENELRIAVDNSPNEKVYPQFADFTFYGGLYRDVNIIAVNATHFDLDYYGGKGLMITPIIDGDNAKVNLTTFITNKGENDQVKYVIKDKEGVVIYEKLTADLSVDTVIENVNKWHARRNPYLYTCEVAIIRDGNEIDAISDRFGCRSYKIDPEKGFILNGEEYPLHGVSRHQDRLGIGNALLPEHHLEDMDLICEVGANTIRLAHYQHAQYFYDLCDERGMVVWAEIPYISHHLVDGRANTISQMKELVVQNYNHASIVVWGLSNEISMAGSSPELIENHTYLNDMVHEMDKTRLTTVACVSMANPADPYAHISDVLSYNHYFGWYGGDTSMNGPWFDKYHAKYPNRAIGVSEYGCEALNWHSSTPMQGDYTEEYQAFYHEELIKQLFTRKYIWSTHVWNMFDFGADARAEGGENGQNHKGLVTMDRKYKKDSFYAYKAWLSDEPFVHLCGKRYIDRVEDVTKVTVYSNLPEVELFANGVSLGKVTADDHFFRFEVPNVGETTLKAVAGDFTDEGIIRKVDKMNEDYLLKEQGAVLNWFDVTTIDGRYSINDKISEIMKSFKGKIWLVKFALRMLKKFKSNKNSPIGKSTKGAKIPGGIMQMVGGFTILRISGMTGMLEIRFTKEELLKYNAELNKIKRK